MRLHGMEMLCKFSEMEIMSEIGRRFQITFGRITFTFHQGKPSELVAIDKTVQIDAKNKQDSLLRSSTTIGLNGTK